MHLFISLRERRPSETFLSSLEQLQKRAFTRVTLSGLPPAQAKLSPSAGVLPAQGRCSWHSPLVPPQLCTSLLDLGHPNSIKHAELSPVRVYYDSGNKQPRTWRFKATQTCYLTVVEARSAKRICTQGVTLKSRCQQHGAPSGGPREESISFPFAISMDCLYPLARGPFLHLAKGNASHPSDSDPTASSLQRPLWVRWAHSNNPG